MTGVQTCALPILSLIKLRFLFENHLTLKIENTNSIARINRGPEQIMVYRIGIQLDRPILNLWHSNEIATPVNGGAINIRQTGSIVFPCNGSIAKSIGCAFGTGLITKRIAYHEAIQSKLQGSRWVNTLCANIEISQRLILPNNRGSSYSITRNVGIDLIACIVANGFPLVCQRETPSQDNLSA